MLDRVRLGGFSGSYKIRNSAELARDKKIQTIGVAVQFLDDTLHTFQIEVISDRMSFYLWFVSRHYCFPQKKAKGSDLLDQVFQHVELSEKDYFGLQFVQQPGDVVVSFIQVEDYTFNYYFISVAMARSKQTPTQTMARLQQCRWWWRRRQRPIVGISISRQILRNRSESFARRVHALSILFTN